MILFSLFISMFNYYMVIGLKKLLRHYSFQTGTCRVKMLLCKRDDKIHQSFNLQLST